ncbi:DNA translocase FtsK [Chloroflexota bacterium]
MSNGISGPRDNFGKRFLNRIFLRPGRVLRLLLLALVVAIIIGFHSYLATMIFETIGFSLFIWLLWLGAIAFVVWKRNQRCFLRRWNFWLGAISLSIAVWGILALFYPADFYISEAYISNVSLGGNAGTNLIGNQGVGAPPYSRLAILIVSGAVLVAPRPSLRLLRRSAKAAQATCRAAYSFIISSIYKFFSSIKCLITSSGRKSAELYRRYPVHSLVVSSIASLPGKLRRRSVAIPEPEVARRFRPQEQPPLTTTGEDKEKAAEEVVIIPNVQEAATPSRQVATEGWSLPSIELLDTTIEVEPTHADNEQRARLIEEALSSYGVDARVTQINPGPAVTQFGIEPGWDRRYKRVVERDKDGNKVERLEEISKTRVKVERITSLSNNLALALAAPSIRIEAPVPGKSLVGIEVPNTTTTSVSLKSIIESRAFQKLSVRSKLAIALGAAPAGESVAADLTKMPHLLIAGATGSGKTVCLNCVITCLLMQCQPEDLRMLLIDPKRVELVSFNGVPHLITPVIVEPGQAVDALRRTIREMDSRFGKFAAVGVRNIEGYNRSSFVTEPMPYLVVVVDELADLMMTAAEVVEPLICRLAQLSRATGIHLIVATQRPSVDVITGLIKANFPTRISFAVASSVDSRTILDTIGAEKLLGRGDMLYHPPDAPKPRRLQGCFVSDQEIANLVDFWKQQQGYTPSLEDAVARAFASLKIMEDTSQDPLMDAAKTLAKEHSQISTSLLQRRLHIGYPRAARLMDLLEQEGVVTAAEPGKPREVFDVDGIEDDEEELENERGE